MADLSNVHVLVTRPRYQAENLKVLLEAQHAVPVLFPTLEIQAIENPTPISETLSHLDHYHWLLFISTNAVNFALKANGGKISKSGNLKIGAVGQNTAQVLNSAGITVDLLPTEGFNTEALLALPAMQSVQGQKILIVRGVGGREQLAETLRERGADVSYLEVYKRAIPDADSSRVTHLLAQQALHAITITSTEALHNLLKMIEKNYHPFLFTILLIVVSDRIGKTAADLGFKHIAVTKTPSDASIIETITTTTTTI